MAEKVADAIKKLKGSPEKRKFDQSFDLIINLKDIDIKKPEGKINEDFRLPNGLGREAKVVLFSDTVKQAGDAQVFTSADVDKFAKDKRSAKKLIRQTDFFVAEPKMMAPIGKTMGQTLAPKGKMPKILSGDPKSLVAGLNSSTRLKVKDAPVIQCVVGRESMDEQKLTENIMAVMKHLEMKLPQGRNNIKGVLLKLTMSKPVKLEVW